ncbi:MAG: DUF2761 domain-containing protein [Burkholderiaceae bacterium]
MVNRILPRPEGWVHPSTRRVAVTVKRYADSSLNGERPCFLYSEEAEKSGVECWRMIDSIDRPTRGSIYDAWPEDGGACIALDASAIVFIMAGDNEALIAEERCRPKPPEPAKPAVVEIDGKPYVVPPEVAMHIDYMRATIRRLDDLHSRAAALVSDIGRTIDEAKK